MRKGELGRGWDEGEGWLGVFNMLNFAADERLRVWTYVFQQNTHNKHVFQLLVSLTVTMQKNAARRNLLKVCQKQMTEGGKILVIMTSPHIIPGIP